jgi:Na+/glutamate symporter
MDIIRHVAVEVWEWMGELPIEFTGLLLRGSLIFVLCVFIGQGIKEMARKGLRDTLPLQIAAFIAAVVIGLAVPFQKLQELTDNQRSALLIASFFGCLILPYVAVRFLVRRKGYQIIACKVIYGIEILLLIIQIIVLITR